MINDNKLEEFVQLGFEFRLKMFVDNFELSVFNNKLGLNHEHFVGWHIDGLFEQAFDWCEKHKG